MKTSKFTMLTAFAASLLVAPIFAQESSPSAASSPPAAGSMDDPAMMSKMMEMAKLNENHKLLASMDGTWNYTVKMWMTGDTSTAPDVSKGDRRQRRRDERSHGEISVSSVGLALAIKRERVGFDSKTSR